MHKYYITQNIILQILYYTNNFAQILYSYLRYADRLSDVFFLLLVVILSELHENLRRIDWGTEKNHIEEFVWRILFFCLHALLLMSFFSLFLSSPSFSFTAILLRKINFTSGIIKNHSFITGSIEKLYLLRKIIYYELLYKTFPR